MKQAFRQIVILIWKDLLIDLRRRENLLSMLLFALLILLVFHFSMGRQTAIFIGLLPGDKYFLKSSIQIAFNDPIPKAWMQARLPIVKDMLVTHLQTISVEQFDDLRSRPIIKNDIKLRINSLFPNKPQWEDTAPVRKILFSEFYRQ